MLRPLRHLSTARRYGRKRPPQRGSDPIRSARKLRGAAERPRLRRPQARRRLRGHSRRDAYLSRVWPENCPPEVGRGGGSLRCLNRGRSGRLAACAADLLFHSRAASGDDQGLHCGRMCHARGTKGWTSPSSYPWHGNDGVRIFAECGQGGCEIELERGCVVGLAAARWDWPPAAIGSGLPLAKLRRCLPHLEELLPRETQRTQRRDKGFPLLSFLCVLCVFRGERFESARAKRGEELLVEDKGDAVGSHPQLLSLGGGQRAGVRRSRLSTDVPHGTPLPRGPHAERAEYF